MYCLSWFPLSLWLELIDNSAECILFYIWSFAYWFTCEGGANFSLTKFILHVSSSWISLSLRSEKLKMWCQAKNSIKFCHALSLSRSGCSPQLWYERNHQLFHDCGHCCMKKRNWWCHLCFKPKLERKTRSQETTGQPGEGNWACL